MIHECIKCKEDFLTEADPFIVFPKPSGSEFQCLRCYQQREAKLIESLRLLEQVSTAPKNGKISLELYREKAREVLKELEVSDCE